MIKHIPFDRNELFKIENGDGDSGANWGGRRDGSGLPKGTRKCQGCGVWNVAAADDNEPWKCGECGGDELS